MGGWLPEEVGERGWRSYCWSFELHFIDVCVNNHARRTWVQAWIEM